MCLPLFQILQKLDFPPSFISVSGSQYFQPSLNSRLVVSAGSLAFPDDANREIHIASL